MSVKIWTVCALIAVIATIVSSEPNKPPQWVEEEPWLPHWVDCEFNPQQYSGPECYDCKTVIHCTPVGGFVRTCWTPDEPHCNNGHCSSEISDSCASIYSVEILEPVPLESLEK